MSLKRPLFIALALSFSFSSLAWADSKPAGNAPVTHDELPGLIKQVLLDNPEMMIEVAQKLQEKQAATAQKQALEGLSKHKDELFADTASPSIGDPKTTDITMVEFFDYHCGYCRQFLSSVVKLAADDKKVRIIFREFPILSEDSAVAARAALAVNHIAPEKYFAYHQALMHSSGKFDETSLVELAKPLGIDTAKMKTEMADPAINDELNKNRKLADELGIRGTPAIILGDQVLPGAMPYDELQKQIALARQAKTMVTKH